MFDDADFVTRTIRAPGMPSLPLVRVYIRTDEIEFRALAWFSSVVPRSSISAVRIEKLKVLKIWFGLWKLETTDVNGNRRELCYCQQPEIGPILLARGWPLQSNADFSGRAVKMPAAGQTQSTETQTNDWQAVRSGATLPAVRVGVISFVVLSLVIGVPIELAITHVSDAISSALSAFTVSVITWLHRLGSFVLWAGIVVLSVGVGREKYRGRL